MSAPVERPIPSKDSTAERPTLYRFVVLAFICSMTFVLYVDRVCYGQALSSIEKDLGIGHADMAWGQIAFLVSYSIFELPVGRWGDKHGSRGVLTRIVVWWSLFTALTGAIGVITRSALTLSFMTGVSSAGAGLTVLVIVRFLFGAGEAGALPNASRIVGRWFPESERGIIRGLITSSMQIGGAVSPMLAAPLIATLGWEWSFATFGALGLVWAGVFYWWFRDDPAERRGLNAAELKLLGHVDGRSSHESHAPIPWKRVLANHNVWLLAVLQMCGAFVSYLYMTWWPTYLKEGASLDEYESSRWTSLVLGCGATGCLAGGVIISRLIRAFGNRAACYRFYGAFAMATSGLLLFAGSRCDAPQDTSKFAAAACFFALSQQATWWASAAEIAGRHVGALFGLMNGLGGLGAGVSIYFVGKRIEFLKNQGITGQDAWAPLLLIYVGVLFFGAVLFPFLNVRKTIEPQAA